MDAQTNTHTEEQTSIFEIAKSTVGNVMINSLAGTGKTYTLEQVDRLAKQKPALYLVFNRRNADEATGRMLSTTTIRTFNGLGHRIWASAIGKQPKLEPKKTYLIYKEICDEAKSQAKVLWEVYDQVRQGVELAKAIGYVPSGMFSNATRLATRTQLHNRLDELPDDLMSELIDTCLQRSIKLSYDGTIDYNDQVYMSALFGGTYPKFPLMLVDEFQDLNPCNHEMIRRLVGNRRLIGVGDPHQNIYGFRGAKAGGMFEATNTHKMQTTHLSVSFRCPEAIVRNAWWLVPHFKWSKVGGHVESLASMDGLHFSESSVVLCRLNAPIFALAFKLVANGIGVSVSGSDIGPKLINQMKKFGDLDMKRSEIHMAIDRWLEAKMARESKTAYDSANCMRIFANQGADLGQAIGYAEHLFAQRGSIQLMTIHKSKGLEFPLVYHLDPQVIGDGQQDKHLRYVAQTRSSDKYFEIASAAIAWKC